MDKSRVCVTQVTKLAKQKCVKKTNLLVYEKKPDPCVRPVPNKGGYVIPPILSVPGKKIRICTGADLRKMCPPKLCDCKADMKHSRGGKRGIISGLMAIVGFGLKAAVAAGLVYWTYNIGLWGDSEETEDIYLDACRKVAPIFCSDRLEKRKFSELCTAETELMCVSPARNKEGICRKPPSTENAAYTFKHYWNSAVVKFFDVLLNFPAYLLAAYHRLANIKVLEYDGKCYKESKLRKKE